MTPEQRDHFADTVIVEAIHDGVAHRLSPTFLEVDDDFPYRAFYGYLIKPGKAKTPQVWTLRFTFTEDHYDGEYTTPAGTVDEGSRTIVWTPRGQFPSGDYEPSPF